MTISTRARRIVREAALWVGGALGSLCLLSFVAGWAFHVTPLVFASGSMTPDYPVGSLGIARQAPASDLELGDVVSVVDDQGVRVTHRIVGITRQAAGVTLSLQGDTNNTPDDQTYTVASAPRVAFDVPYVGYVLNAAASPYGVAVTAAAVMGLLLLGFGGPGGTPTRRRTRALIPAGVLSVLVVGGVAGASGVAPWAFTSAYWTDSATATTTASVAAATDTTAPVLSNPVPADQTSAALWSGLSCSASANQICVTATDEAGGSGINASTVTVKLVRTSGTTQCWNGTAWVNGTGCAAQTMTLVSGNQYRTSGLTSALMTQGTYQATFNAKDVAGNAATALVVSFAVEPAPVITSCVSNGNGNSNGYTLKWTWAGTVTTSFKLYYGGGGSLRTPDAITVSGAQPYTWASQFINNETGTFRIVAVVNGIESPTSNGYSYTGQGNAKTCT